MHYCPDCGEECDCSCFIVVDDEDCAHVCKMPEEIDYDQDVDDGLFNDYTFDIDEDLE